MTSETKQITNYELAQLILELKNKLDRTMDDFTNRLDQQRQQISSLGYSISELNRIAYSTQQQLRDIYSRLDRLDRDRVVGTGESTALGYPYPYR